MRPFNLEEAKAGKPIQLDNGTPARFIAHVPELNQVIALLDTHETVKVSFWGEDGSYFNYWGYGEIPNKLVMVSVKKTVWVNLYSDICDRTCYWHDSEEIADKEQMDSVKRLGGKAFPIEIEE